MRKSSIRLIPLLGLLAAASTACGGDAAEEPAGPSVTFVEPANGATVAGPDVSVVLETTGVEIAPVSETREGTGHHHIFIDTAVTPEGSPIPPGSASIRHFGTGATEVVLTEMQPGTHQLIAVVGDWQHIPIAALDSDTITITVTAPAAPADSAATAPAATTVTPP